MSDARSKTKSALQFRRPSKIFNYSKKTGKSYFSAVSIVIGGLIFCAIALCAGADVWAESAILTTIFILGAASIFSRKKSADREIKLLLAPFLLLAGYSFVQGLLTLFVQKGVLAHSDLLPYSFDLTASFWCASKFLAAAIFIKIISTDCRKNINFLIWSLAAAGNFYALFGIFRYLLQANFPDVFATFILPELRPEIGFGTFINQNHFAFLMLMNLGLNGGLCAYGKLEKPLRLLLFVFSIITWTAIVLTASRGGIISSFVVITVLILAPVVGFAKDNKRFSPENYLSGTFSLGKRLVFFAFLVVALVFAVALIGQDRVAQRFEEIPTQLSGGDSYGFSRIDVWRATFKMIDGYRIYGIGFGSFRYAVARYIDISGAVVPQQAHDDYLELAASGGVIAVFCSIWFLYVFFRTLKKRFSEPATPLINAARIGAVGACAGIAVHNFFDFGLQFIGNWLFLAAILSIAVYRENAVEPEKNDESLEKFVGGNSTVRRFSRAFFLLGLACGSFWFGLSRLENRLAVNGSGYSFEQNNSAKIPFDADFYAAQAVISQRTEAFDTAAANLETAIEYRPNDYVLWLELGKVRQIQNQPEMAESAFQKAIELAPLYGEPHFYRGKFLLENNRKAEGFDELRFAVRRDPRRFAEVLALARRETNDNADATVKLLSPENALEKTKIIEFLLDRKAYVSIAALVCRETDLAEKERADLIVKLLEKRQIFYAHQISERNCDSANRVQGNLSDGDFEAGDLSEGFGFGWRVGDLPDSVKIGFDEQTAASGRRSLKFVFDGDSDPSLPLISQIVSVGKNQKYQLSFAYRAEEIVSGGVPILLLILKQPDGDTSFKEIKLTIDKNGWIKFSTAIETGEKTEALEIRLARHSCGQSLCPIFGRLWLDDFVLTPVEAQRK